jgi:hypothetical protein
VFVLSHVSQIEFGGTCHISGRPYTVFRWRPGSDARYKKTIICQEVAKSKNVCQVRFETTVGSRSRLQLLCRWCCMQDGLIHGRGNRQRSSLSTAAAQLRAPTAGVCKGTQHWGVCGWLV